MFHLFLIYSTFNHLLLLIIETLINIVKNVIKQQLTITYLPCTTVVQ